MWNWGLTQDLGLGLQAKVWQLDQELEIVRTGLRTKRNLPMTLGNGKKDNSKGFYGMSVHVSRGP